MDLAVVHASGGHHALGVAAPTNPPFIPNSSWATTPGRPYVFSIHTPPCTTLSAGLPWTLH